MLDGTTAQKQQTDEFVYTGKYKNTEVVGNTL
jgi:hypothetical protein